MKKLTKRTRDQLERIAVCILIIIFIVTAVPLAFLLPDYLSNSTDKLILTLTVLSVGSLVLCLSTLLFTAIQDVTNLKEQLHRLNQKQFEDKKNTELDKEQQ